LLIDANDLDGQGPLSADVCVVGAGPAGLAIAATLARADIPTIVLEQGGRSAIGGNALRWLIELGSNSKNGVRLAPLPPETFEPRPGLDLPAWPIAAADLAPYYRQAQQVFGLSPFGFSAEDWEAPGARRLPLPADRLVTSIYQFAEGRAVHEDLVQDLAQAAAVRIVHGAVVRRITTAEGGTRAQGVALVTTSGRPLEVRARTVVLAAGGLDNAHLLLLSQEGRQTAIGDEHGQLGRHYMDHPLLDGGDFVPRTPRLIDAMALYDLRRVHDLSVMGHLRLAPELVQGQDLLQLSVLFFPRETDHRRRYRLTPRQERSLRAVFEFRSHLRTGGLANLTRVPRMLSGVDALVAAAWRDLRGRYPRLGRGGWSERPRPSATFGALQVVHQVEQPPRWSNRVRLGREADRWGRPVLEREWAWHEADMARTLAAQELVAAELAAAGLGEYHIARDGERPLILTLSCAHPMGTTRMHADPRQGVVDATCRVHAVDNVYVAGSSTFTTGSFINPTLTAVALALRIADTIKARHARPMGEVRTRSGREAAAQPRELALT
jgi:choline dehydrogenase-like flavoprotein